VPLPRHMRDNPADYPPIPRAAEVTENNARLYERILRTSLPLITGSK
jgi:hypothetical protein